MAVIFSRFLDISISSIWLIAAVILLRLALMRYVPRRLLFGLWSLPAIRLLCWKLPESPWSITPKITVLVEPSVSTGVSEASIFAKSAPWIWIGGILLLLVYAVISTLRMRHMVHTAMRKTGRVWICDNISTPFVSGLLSPRIYLPSDMNEQTTAYVLAHEAAHIKRLDHWWKAFAFTVLMLHWFNPVVWFAFSLFSKDMELACDESAVKKLSLKEKKEYAKALLTCSISGQSIGLTQIAFDRISVKERVQQVLKPKPISFGNGLMVCFIGVVLAVLFLTAPTNAQQIADTSGNTNASQPEGKPFYKEDPDTGTVEEFWITEISDGTYIITPKDTDE